MITNQKGNLTVTDGTRLFACQETKNGAAGPYVDPAGKLNPCHCVWDVSVCVCVLACYLGVQTLQVGADVLDAGTERVDVQEGRNDP